MIIYKLIIIGIFLCPLICPIIYSQQKIKSSVIIDYINKIDSLNNIALVNIQKTSYKSEPLKDLAQEMNLDDLKHIAALMFNASDLDHIALMDSSHAQYFRNKESNSQELNTINRISTEYKLQKEMEFLISPTVYALTRVAYFLHVRVERVKSVIPQEEGVIHAETPVINAIVKEVYKGTGKFKIGDHVQFYYYKFWMKENNSFEVGREYLVPLEPRGEYLAFEKLIALVPYLDDSNGFYPIISNYLIDKYNYFGFGEKVPYDTFNQKLRDKIREVKSW